MSNYHRSMGVQGPRRIVYDVMQVCEHGHIVTSFLTTMPETSKRFCSICGQQTLDRCPECQEPIRGSRVDFPAPVNIAPNNCHECGSAYPWRQAAIANAIEVAQAEVDAAQAEEVAKLVRSIAAASPRMEADALKLGKILSGIGTAARKAAYQAFIDITAKAIADKIFPG